MELILDGLLITQKEWEKDNIMEILCLIIWYYLTQINSQSGVLMKITLIILFQLIVKQLNGL